MTGDGVGLVVSAATCVLAAWLSVHVTAGAATGHLARNGLAGIRTRATRASDESWRAGHRAALPAVRPGAVGCTVLAVVTAALVVLGAQAAALAALCASVVALLGGVVVGAVRAQRAARALSPG